MGMDPVTMAMIGSAGVSAWGALKGQNTQQDMFNQRQAQGQSMMKTGGDPYQALMQQILQQQPAAVQRGVGTGNIDTQSAMQSFNPGQDALLQFMRSDPSKQMAFDTSKAFDNLQAMDTRTQNNAVAGLNANFGGMGQRFGSAAMRQTSDLLANLGAQTGTRNAGIFERSFENQQNRSLQGSGQMLQGAMALGSQGNQMAQMATQLAIANQGNSQFNSTFNQNANNQYFQQRLQGVQAGFGMQNANDQYNMGLFNSMNGMSMPQGNAFTAIGGAGTDISQLMMLMGLLNKKPATPGVTG